MILPSSKALNWARRSIQESGPGLGSEEEALDRLLELAWRYERESKRKSPARDLASLMGQLVTLPPVSALRLLRYELERITSTKGQFVGPHRIGPHEVTLAFPKTMLCIDVSEDTQLRERSTIRDLQDRYLYFSRLGWAVLRMSYSAVVKNPPQAANEIARFCNRAKGPV